MTRHCDRYDGTTVWHADGGELCEQCDAADLDAFRDWSLRSRREQWRKTHERRLKEHEQYLQDMRDAGRYHLTAEGAEDAIARVERLVEDR